jgi:hypothetical protein
MGLIDVTACTNALKWIWSSLEYAWAEESPFAAVIPHKSDLKGIGKYLPIVVGGQRAGNSFSDVLALQNAPTVRRFLLQRRKLYSLGTIDEEAMYASQGDDAALVDVMKLAIESAQSGFGRRLAKQLWGNGGGSLGRSNGTWVPASQTLTLLNADDMPAFDYDMEVELSTDDGIAGAGVLAGSATISGMNIENGNILTDAASGTWAAQIPAAAVSNYLFAKGDYGLGIQGVMGWAPATAPVFGDNWCGVDRSVAVHILAGQRYNCAGANIEDALFDSVGKGKRAGARYDLVCMSPTAYATLQKNAYSKGWFQVAVKNSTNAEIGFDTIGFASAGMKIAVLSEPYMPSGYMLLTRKDSWQLAHAGGLPHFAEVNGSKFWPSTVDDALSFRLKSYLNLGNTMPRDTMLVTL